MSIATCFHSEFLALDLQRRFLMHEVWLVVFFVIGWMLFRAVLLLLSGAGRVQDVCVQWKDSDSRILSSPPDARQTCLGGSCDELEVGTRHCAWCVSWSLMSRLTSSGMSRAQGQSPAKVVPNQRSYELGCGRDRRDDASLWVGGRNKQCGWYQLGRWLAGGGTVPFGFGCRVAVCMAVFRACVLFLARTFGGDVFSCVAIQWTKFVYPAVTATAGCADHPACALGLAFTIHC